MAPVLKPVELKPVLQKKKGSCQLYKTEGAYCASFDKINGFCSCGPDLSCKSYRDPAFYPILKPVTAVMLKPVTANVLDVSKRAMIPGYKSTCEKADFVPPTPPAP